MIHFDESLSQHKTSQTVKRKNKVREFVSLDFKAGTHV